MTKMTIFKKPQKEITLGIKAFGKHRVFFYITLAHHPHHPKYDIDRSN